VPSRRPEGRARPRLVAPQHAVLAVVPGLAPRMQRTPRRRLHSRGCIANTSTALSGLWGGAVRQGDGRSEALPLAPLAHSAAEARPRGSPFPVRSREAPRSRAACHRGPPRGTDGPQHTPAELSRVKAPTAAGTALPAALASPAGRASSAAWPQPGVVEEGAAGEEVEFEQRSMETDRRLSAAADRRRPAVASRTSRKRVHRRRFHTCTLNRTMLWAAASAASGSREFRDILLKWCVCAISTQIRVST
jgi:hypothetical protein